MAKKRFNIKGTKDFLILAVFLGFLCVWAIRDAWFPTEKILKKHPLEIPVAFSVPGVVSQIPVQPGDKIEPRTLLASLRDEPYKLKVADAEKAYSEAKNSGADDVEEKMEALKTARADLQACSLYNTDIMLADLYGEGDKPLRGKILEILVSPATAIEAGQPVLTIRPQDTFYLFNKSLSIFSFFGAAAALIFHWLASK
ncbi:MAG: hypothetical protein WC959_04545 [Kiritimatiellales bacterium]